ncbi:MAG: hypothetical protein MJZ25_09150 [Fibrobacter sp.]|nr:hypothetical protein [Fibrobacter sp.]
MFRNMGELQELPADARQTVMSLLEQGNTASTDAVDECNRQIVGAGFILHFAQSKLACSTIDYWLDMSIRDTGIIDHDTIIVMEMVLCRYVSRNIAESLVDKWASRRKYGYR